MKNFQNERLVAAAINVGEAAKAIELTLEYTRERKAFGGYACGTDRRSASASPP